MSKTIEQIPDFRIDADGQWFHDGAPIKRAALAKLFSDRALKVDGGGNYWLQTPFEKYPVAVADVPYVIVDYTIKDETITFRTNMDEEMNLNDDTIWELRNGIPYIEIRDGLFARMGRSVYYNLIETYGATIKFNVREFSLGEMNE